MPARVHSKKVRIHLEDGGAVSGRLCSPGDRNDALLVLAHGAGNDMDNPFLSFVHEGVAASGIASLRFNFPYKEAGRRAPDSKTKLEAAWRSVLGWARSHPELSECTLFAGGKSLGGRIASQVVAQGESVEGLVFLGYPLHPPNRRDKLRTAHFGALRAPALFIQGTRDSLCDLSLLRDALKGTGWPTEVHVIEGGDHSFNVPKRMGVPQQSVWREIVAKVCEWIARQQ